ncbi:DUF6894 family protein [Bradyrhizobium zhanjiangense]|uniref:DUF6894 domain-containing protein n=1 Tax=Bradyrhizobium zhanjiangense TaxID=1325107 RepID=A0A4Q0QE91_9BRAD|nr:hypothetical protein [Bradyrhizobium zhanjiangense]RXG89237.1 hypothetical protein EAS61_28150 [Bradyrhizobium zhanjiangense]
MPRYFFDLRDENELIRDEEGLELSGFPAVQAEAAKSLADMARDAVPTSRLPAPGKRHMAIEVRDGSSPVLQVKFTLEVEPL